MKVQQYKDVLVECLVTLRHARTFVISREKMHPTGIELYDKLIVDVENALKSPGPAGELDGCSQPPSAVLSEDRTELLRRLENISSYDESDAWDVIVDAMKALRQPEPPFASLLNEARPYIESFAHMSAHPTAPTLALALRDRINEALGDAVTKSERRKFRIGDCVSMNGLKGVVQGPAPNWDTGVLVKWQGSDEMDMVAGERLALRDCDECDKAPALPAETNEDEAYRVFCPKHDTHKARYHNGRPELDDQCPTCAIGIAYGWLWHVKNMPEVPTGIAPEQASYKARHALRDLLSHEQRGEYINRVAEMIRESETKVRAA